MSNHTSEILILFDLLTRAVSGGESHGESLLSHPAEIWDALYSMVQKHDLAHLVGHMLEKQDLPSREALSKFRSAKMRAIYRYARMSYEYEQICQTLESAQIPFVPLKGSVLRDYYPEPWMRTSCDIDVLVHEEDLSRAADALTACGWRVDEMRVIHDISLHSASGIHLELHFSLTENMDNIDPLLKRVWDYCSLVPGKQYEYRQSKEYFLFHHLAHMSYHFVAGGCGIRPVLDLWILERMMSFDENALRELLREARLETFYESVSELVKVWFENAPHNARTAKMEAYILNGGTYGSLANRVLVEQARAGSGTKNTWQRIFQPYDQLCSYYPILKKYKFLTPVFQVVRWFRVLMTGRFRHSVQELKINRSNSVDQVEEAKKFLTDIGLTGIHRSTRTQD